MVGWSRPLGAGHECSAVAPSWSFGALIAVRHYSGQWESSGPLDALLVLSVLLATRHHPDDLSTSQLLNALLATQHHPGCPEPPDRRCGARAVPELHEPKHFALSRRDILSELECFPVSGIIAGAVQKFPESKYLELRPKPPELDHFPGFGADVGTVGH